MTPNDFLALLGTLLGIGAGGIAVLRYIIRAEIQAAMASLNDATLGPLASRVTTLEGRVHSLEADVSRLDAA